MILTELIKQLYDKHTARENDDLVSAIDFLAYEGFSGDEFIQELLQNFDDAYEDMPTLTEFPVQINLTANYLILSHKGKRFEEGNLKTLCKVGDKKNAKKQKQQQTGNKGIGFKSVFHISDEVWIASHDDLFMFDKQHVHGKHEHKTDNDGVHPYRQFHIAKIRR